jgi:hypothetical protein
MPKSSQVRVGDDLRQNERGARFTRQHLYKAFYPGVTRLSRRGRGLDYLPECHCWNDLCGASDR